MRSAFGADHRAIHWTVGASVSIIVTLVLIGVASADNSFKEPAHVPSKAAIPPGFEAVNDETAISDPGLDSIVKRTTVSVHYLPEGKLLLIRGSHDALESMLPERVVQPGSERHTRIASKDGWHYLAITREDDLTLDRVGMIYAPGLKRMPVSARLTTESAEPGTAVDRDALIEITVSALAD